MENVVNKRCALCPKQPNFGFKDKGIRERCGKHVVVGMVDLIHPRCTECELFASFGIPGQGLTACSEHRRPGMQLHPNKRCHLCPNPATHGTLSAGKAVRCGLHVVEGDLNLLERQCTSCGLLYVLDRNDRCESCDPGLFRRARLAKQRDVTDYLDSQGLRGMQTDRMVDRGVCGRERPDRLYLLPNGSRYLVLEVDEQQHRGAVGSYSPSCEAVRMFNIGQSLGGTPVSFIRFNPDGYIPAPGGVVVPLRERKRLLAELLRDLLTGEPYTTPSPFQPPLGWVLVEAMHLFYDGYGGAETQPWVPVTPA